MTRSLNRTRETLQQLTLLPRCFKPNIRPSIELGIRPMPTIKPLPNRFNGRGNPAMKAWGPPHLQSLNPKP